jgi:hypothetical protein
VEGVQKSGGGGSFAAVMAHFQDVCAGEIEQLRFDGLFGVAGEQERMAAVGKAEHKGIVVVGCFARGVVGAGRQDLDGGTAERERDSG